MTIELATSRTLRLQPLTFVDEVDGVMVGRPDTASYGVFPKEGAELLKRVSAGEPLDECARWWNDTVGETLDVEDLLETLDDLGFIVPDGEQPAEPVALRWLRLARWTFSPLAWGSYLALIVAGAVVMVFDAGLRPSYRNVFFTSHISLIPIVLALSQFPCIVLHEFYHSLAGRRLGLPSTFGIGRRFYFLVAETRLDSIYSVPRHKRYLPFLAGMLIDAVMVAAFTLLCALGRELGAPRWLSGLALALAFTAVMRLVWQLMFYLQTDLYFVVATAAGCSDLQGATRARLARWWRAVIGRPHREDDDRWSAHDHRAARWYAPVLIAGYGFSLASLIIVALPTTIQFWTTVLHRLDGSQPRSLGLVVDTAGFLLITLTQLGLLAYVTVRDLRRRLHDRSARRSLGSPS